MLRRLFSKKDSDKINTGEHQQPLKVLHVGKYYPPYRGGMESFLADLIEQQRACGLDARAVVHGAPLPDDPEWIIRVPVQITLVFAPIALGFPLALCKAIRDFQPDVLHLHMPNNAAFWALVIPSARRIPWVTHWHSDVLISQWDTLLKACYQLYKPFETKLLQHSEAILATSPPYMAASQPLQPWLYKTVAVPLGLRPLQEDVLEQAREESVDEWGDAELRILSVGRLTYYKGFDTLISAVAGFNNVQLIIAGEGEQRAELEALIAKERIAQGCANVLLLGSVSEAKKHALFNSCNIFALASRERTEAFGLVLIEAMQHGKPCIASDLDGSGMSWVVGQSGAGQCYAPDQVQAWKGAIVQALNAKAQLVQRGKVAQEVADQQFTVVQCERSIGEIYASALPPVINDLPTARVQRKQLCVAIIRKQQDLAMLAQWRPAHSDQLLLCVDASKAVEVAESLIHNDVLSLSVRDMSWSSLLALLQRMVAEQGFDALSILPAEQLPAWGEQRQPPAANISPSQWARWLCRSGIQHRRLSRDGWILQGQNLLDWLLTKHVSINDHVFSIDLRNH